MIIHMIEKHGEDDYTVTTLDLDIDISVLAASALCSVRGKLTEAIQDVSTSDLTPDMKHEPINRNPTPCDEPPHICPYSASYGHDCRNQCGVGVDEDHIEEDYDHSDCADMMACDISGICSGSGCSQYYECDMPCKG